jgi:hypothetical protein
MSDLLEVIGKTIPVALISDHCTATDDSDCPHNAIVDEIEINLKDDDVSWSNVDKDGIIVKDDLVDRSLMTEHAAIPIVRGGEEVNDSVDEDTSVVSSAIEDIKDIISNRNDDSRPALLDDSRPALLDDNNASALIVNDSSTPALIDSDSSAPSHTSSASTPAPIAEIVKKDRYGFMITDRFHSSTDLNEPSVVEERKQKEIQRVKKWISMKNKWKSHCWYVDRQRNIKTSSSPGTTEAVDGAVVKSSSGGTSTVINKLTKSSKLKSRIRKGIPDVFRGTVL